MTDRNIIAVAPLPIYAHLQPYRMVIYNGHGEPLAVYANPEDMFFITHRCPHAAIMMFPPADFGDIPS